MRQILITLAFAFGFYVSTSAQQNNTSKAGVAGKSNISSAKGRTLSADSLVTSDGRWDSLYRSLPEVMITGERPIVKATQGKLIYDLPRLICDLPVDNAYDAIKELPGVVAQDDGLTLAGRSVTVILDGKVSTLTTEQLNTLLKSIPSSRIDKAEVMYSAPARYQVRGALINITLKQNESEAPSLQGELFSEYNQKHYEDFKERGSLVYSYGKFSADMLYSYENGRTIFVTDKRAIHTLADGSKHNMDTHEMSRIRGNSHNVRLGMDYNFSKDHQLSFVYTGKYDNNHNRASVEGAQISNTQTRNTSQLHNGRLDYRTPFGLKSGAEFTYYNTPSSQLLHSSLNGDELDFVSRDVQRINRWKFFLSQEYKLGKGWGMNYGVVYTTSLDHSHQYYYDVETGDLLTDKDNMKSRRREQTWNFYAGFNKNFGDKLSMDFSLATEQYHTTVWKDWNWFPTLNLNYTPSAGNVWQFSFTSDKSYPEYWATQDAISYMGGGYSEIHGNPDLKPSIDYQAQLTYILKGKYVFTTWYSYEKDDFKQLLYQSPERLVEIYKVFNSNFDQQAGVQSVIPFKAGQWLNSRLMLIGVYDRQKNDHYWDIPYDRHVVYGMAVLTNTFTLSSKPDLKLTVKGMIRSKAIQGVYDLPSSGNLDAALRYTFAGKRAILSLSANDIFETSQITPRIRYATQYVQNNYKSFRQIGISFTYKFGGYKEKQHENVDTSRFK
jgi:hypothetical protein